MLGLGAWFHIPMLYLWEHMKKIVLGFGLMFFGLMSASVNAQGLFEQLSRFNNLNEVRENAEAYFNAHGMEAKRNATGEEEDNDFLRYKRAEWFWKQRVMPDGTLPDFEAQRLLYAALQPQAQKTTAATWRSISQTTSTSGYNGMGRLACVAFHPTDTNIIYVGANKGGIWRTTVGGNSWEPLGDQLPFCSVGNIVVDRVNPSILYITVGLNEGWWHYGLGVYKSTDAGQTWTATPQSTPFTAQVVYYKLMAHPDSNQVLYSAQSNGLFKSADAGATWTLLRAGLHRDIEFKPYNSATMFVAAEIGVFRSVNRGATWTTVYNFGTATNSELSVTPADSNVIGIATSNKNFYRSLDGGNTPAVLMNNAIDDNEVLQYSHLNAQRVYCGYVTNHRSTNGGQTWTKITNWYNDGVLPAVHADNHYADVNPLVPHYIYVCNDGGLYRYNELTQTWKDLSDGLIITEFYKIAHSQQDSTFLIGGTQDNGGRKRIAPGVWGATNGGDGMEVAVHAQNDQIMYTTYWGGTLYRSYDQWVNDTYDEITPDTAKGAWVTPYLLRDQNQSEVLAGYADVWYSDDDGNSWGKISNNLTGNYSTKLEMLDASPANANYIIAGYDNRLFITTNFGFFWNARNIPGSSSLFEQGSMVVCHPTTPNEFVVTKGGYGAGRKVYRSADTGMTWQNITYNLPNVPANCLRYDKGSDTSNYDMYVGTDVGVFFKKELDTVWQYYGLGLPNTAVTDLEIFYPTGKLRAGTYGRGIWETDLVRAVFPATTGQTTRSLLDMRLRGNPVAESVLLELTLPLAGNWTMRVLDAQGRMLKQSQGRASAGTSTLSCDVSFLASGTYFIECDTEQGRNVLPFVKQ